MRSAIALAAAAAAITALAATPQDWYAPEDGWNGGNAGKVQIIKQDGTFETYEVERDGTSPDLSDMIINLIAEGAKDLAKAYQALYEALQAQMMVRNMAENLDSLFEGGTADISSTDGASNPGGSFQFRVGKGGAVSLTLSGVTSVKAGSGLTKSGDTIGIRNWNDAYAGWTLAEQLSSKTQTGRENYAVMAQIPGRGGIAYVPIGNGIEGGGGSDPDGETISKNTDGELEMRNWSSEGKSKASDCVIPYADDADGVKWGRFFGFFNGDVFDWNESEKRVQLEGWMDGMGTRHYFGTGDTEGEFGFHELPNVTTNNVAGDGVTIDSTTVGDVKRLGLRGWPTGQGAAVVADVNGEIAYLPYQEIGTNAVMAALDDASVASNSSGKVEIKGWASQSAASDTVVGLLKDGPGGGGYNSYEVVCRNAGSVAYIPFGGLFPHPDEDLFAVDSSTAEFRLRTEAGKVPVGTADNGIEWRDPAASVGVDGVSIVTNAAGTLSIYGMGGEQDEGKVLTRTQNGVAWEPSAGGSRPDGESVVTNSAGRLSISGFGGAAAGDVPVVGSGGGSLAWIPASSAGTAIKFVGTDGTFATVGGGVMTNTVTFAYGTGSNVTVTVTGDAAGNAVLTIGAVWR